MRELDQNYVWNWLWTPEFGGPISLHTSKRMFWTTSFRWSFWLKTPLLVRALTLLSNYIRNLALPNIWGFFSFHHTRRFADGFRTWIGADFCRCCCCTKWRRLPSPCQHKTIALWLDKLLFKNVYNSKNVWLSTWDPSHLKQVIIGQFSLRRGKACKVGNTGYPGEVLGLPPWIFTPLGKGWIYSWWPCSWCHWLIVFIL